VLTIALRLPRTLTIQPPSSSFPSWSSINTFQICQTKHLSAIL
jgi:hypothetical protein